jgi:hypothetical protein
LRSRPGDYSASCWRSGTSAGSHAGDPASGSVGRQAADARPGHPRITSKRLDIGKFGPVVGVREHRNIDNQRQIRPGLGPGRNRPDRN